MENKKIDFIKWMGGYTEGFFIIDRYKLDEWTVEVQSKKHSNMYSWCRIDFDYVEWNEVFYPLLLQRAIEGINRKHDLWVILQWNSAYKKWDINVIKEFECLFTELNENPDICKEAALKYIFEQDDYNVSS